MNHASPRRKGFTLVEIMIVVVIIGLLAMLAVPAYQKLRRNSAGRAMIVDAREIGGALRQIAAEHPKAARNGTTFTISVARDGTLSSAPVSDGDDTIAPNIIAQYIRKISPGTESPITYTFGAPEGEKAFSLTHAHCAPSDISPNSTINNSTTIGSPVQFDASGEAL